MSVARDFEDIERDFGGQAVREALAAAQTPGREFTPVVGLDSQPLVFKPEPYVWRDPATLPRREWLYGFELQRKHLSAVVAPGASGKTTYKVGRAICMATGRELMGKSVWGGPHRVWLWNLEDPVLEIEKTVAAFLKHWEIDPRELGDRLILNGSDWELSRELKLAVSDGGGSFRLQRQVSAAVITAVKEFGVDYLDIDPSISSHSVDENDNGAIDAMAKEWVHVAQETNCAVNLACHTRKIPTGTELGARDARGASSLGDAARSVLVLQTMTKDTATDLAVPDCERKRYFSVYDDKNNKAPAALHADWFRFCGVGLGNGDDVGPEDNIGICERWTPPDRFAGITTRHLLHIQKLIDEHPEKARKHFGANWVGHLIAESLGKDSSDVKDKKDLRRMVDVWTNEGVLTTVIDNDRKSNPVEFVRVGRWAEL